METSGKGLVTSLSFKTKVRSKNTKRKVMPSEMSARKKIEKLPYEKRRPKHEPTDSYFHLSRKLVKCMMISDNLNWHDHGGYTKMNAPSLNINVTDKDE